jgi:hypothetical protein
MLPARACPYRDQGCTLIYLGLNLSMLKPALPDINKPEKITLKTFFD